MNLLHFQFYIESKYLYPSLVPNSRNLKVQAHNQFRSETLETILPVYPFCGRIGR